MPEVSLICPSKPVSNSYDRDDKLWSKGNSKLEKNCPNIFRRESTLRELQIHKDTGSIVTRSQFNRKQVRFESPILQQRPSLSYEPFSTRKPESLEPNESGPKNTWDLHKESSENSEMQKIANFKDIYMANIPNRHLDLSIIDMQKAKVNNAKTKAPEEENIEDKENELPKTYKEFLETQNKIVKAQKKDQNVAAQNVIDILNYKRPSIEMFQDTFPTFTNTLLNDSRKSSDNKINFSHRYNLNQNENKAPTCHSTSVTNEILAVKSESLLSNKESCNSLQYRNVNFSRHNETNDAHSNHNTSDFTTKYIEVSKQTEGICIQKESKDIGNYDITNRDLLHIIAKQNEQLLLLQKQVALLLTKDYNSQSKPIESAPRPRPNDEEVKMDSEPQRFIPEINLTPRKKHGLSKFSVDVMTSFEVAIRPQHNRSVPANCNNSKIQEITEEECTVTSSTDLTKKNAESSIHFQEPFKVIEPCQSPVPSININMNDYDSSE